MRLASSNPDPEINPEGGTILRDEDIRLLVTVVLVLMRSWRHLPRPLQRWLLSRTKQIRTDELTFDGLCFGILQLTIAAELAGLDGYQCHDSCRACWTRRVSKLQSLLDS